MAKSILQKDKECYLCRRFYNLRTVRGLEEHHILFGRGRRELSEQYGLKVWLCHIPVGRLRGQSQESARQCRKLPG